MELKSKQIILMFVFHSAILHETLIANELFMRNWFEIFFKILGFEIWDNSSGLGYIILKKKGEIF